MNEKLLDKPDSDELLPHYDLDYRRAKPNPYVTRDLTALEMTVKIDADVAAVFTSAESINAVLRALIQTMPQTATAR